MLKRAWKAWKRVARQIGDFQARVLLTAVYAVVILPFGVLLHIFADPLRIRRRPMEWIDRDQDSSDVTWARRQW
jgi:hypothetical protein